MTTDDDMERAREWLDANSLVFHKLDLDQSPNAVRADKKLAAAQIATLIQEVRSETLEEAKQQFLEGRKSFAKRVADEAVHQLVGSIVDTANEVVRIGRSKGATESQLGFMRAFVSGIEEAHKGMSSQTQDRKEGEE